MTAGEGPESGVPDESIIGGSALHLRLLRYPWPRLLKLVDLDLDLGLVFLFVPPCLLDEISFFSVSPFPSIRNHSNKRSTTSFLFTQLAPSSSLLSPRDLVLDPRKNPNHITAAIKNVMIMIPSTVPIRWLRLQHLNAEHVKEETISSLFDSWNCPQKMSLIMAYRYVGDSSTCCNKTLCWLQLLTGHQEIKLRLCYGTYSNKLTWEIRSTEA